MTQEALYEHILYTMQTIAYKKQVIPQDLLGRSLAYNCFLPRLSDKTHLYETLKRKIAPKKALYSNIEALSKILQTSTLEHNIEIDSEILCVLIDDCHLDNKQQEYINTFDYLSMLRRLLPAFIIHYSAFIDVYQILETAIGGADMIILDIAYLYAYIQCKHTLESNPLLLDSDIAYIVTQIIQDNCVKELRNSYNGVLKDNKEQELYNNACMLTIKESDIRALQIHMDTLVAFSYNLGLIPIIRIRYKQDLELLYTLQHFPHCIYAPQELVRLLPTESIIFADGNMACNKHTQQHLIDVCIVTE